MRIAMVGPGVYCDPEDALESETGGVVTRDSTHPIFKMMHYPFPGLIEPV